MISDFDKGWIIGFIEGEGCFTHDIQGGKSKNNIHVPRFCINQINKVPLEFLKKFFGGGNIYTRSYKNKAYWSKNKSTRYDYIVRDRVTLEKIKDLLNGQMKHPDKIIQFERWKKFFNNFVGKEGQRKKAREDMIRRWKNPAYRAKILTALKPFWEHNIRSKLAKKGWETKRKKEALNEIEAFESNRC